eukprot:CAMPEP_0181185794 /NCGR_PEP_ID=MMETSP1096-20121128/9697_1 /TAXON_ID=156174 ORGANISM="Chrysochromulina ericina, Strain CCMP281" /NCGR_SAMPLE_ID=MMETSP1096 /ASSEMBLY_ACC=CAM_ASM_000453 /LENGTH=191 /DNA_ID=CAMNT_0023274661 /DNA_START=118 /DNA_END=692 /DNA_ORIENTATION=-
MAKAFYVFRAHYLIALPTAGYSAVHAARAVVCEDALADASVSEFRSIWRGAAIKLKTAGNGRATQQLAVASLTSSRSPAEVADLSDKKMFLLNELLIRSFVLEFPHKTDEPLLIAKEQIEHSRLFVRVGHEYFEYVERLVLNVRTPVTKKRHHYLEVVRRRNEPRHYCKIGTIEQQLPEELHGLAFGDIII